MHSTRPRLQAFSKVLWLDNQIVQPFLFAEEIVLPLCHEKLKTFPDFYDMFLICRHYY